MGTVLADVADALGLTEKTVGSALNRSNLADVVFELSLRFKLPVRATAEIAGVSEGELAAAATRSHMHHRREMQEQSRVASERKVGVVRKRHGPIGEPPSPHHLWCKRMHHWVDEADMTVNNSRPSGYGDWCRGCFRDYWAETKKAKQAAKKKAERPVGQ